MITALFTTSSITGYAYVSKFVFTDITTSTHPIVSRYWDFGDNTNTYNTTTTEHIYTYPGTYNITLSVADITGSVAAYTQTLFVDYGVRDRVMLIQTPSTLSEPGLPSTTTFKVAVTSAQINQPLLLQLHSSNSRATPQTVVHEKWKFLIPTWRFTDKQYSTITTLSVDPLPLYDNMGNPIGSHGEAEFYYIDDLGADYINTTCPLLLSITLLPSSFTHPEDSKIYNFPSYANSDVTCATTEWQINSLAPTHLKVTGNYIDDIHPVKWIDVKIPFLITTHNHKQTTLINSLTTSNLKTGILHTFPSSNAVGDLHDIHVSLLGVPVSAYTVESLPLRFQAYSGNRTHRGGTAFGYITPHIPISSTSIVASIDSTPPYLASTFTLPYDQTIPTFIWLSNPTHNTLHQLTYIHHPTNCPAVATLNNNISNSRTLVTQVPYITSSSTFNYKLTGFSGVYGLAIDPYDLSVLAVDAETDTIYRYDSSGSMLSALHFNVVGSVFTSTNGSSLITSDGNSLVLTYDENESLTPSYISLDNDYNFWVSFYNSVSVLKFDRNFNYLCAAVPPQNVYEFVDDGDFSHKPPVVETDIYNNIWVTYAQTLCSAVSKYDPYGNLQLNIDLPVGTIPTGMAIGPDNSVWISNTSHTSLTSGSIHHYSDTGILLHTVTDFTRPSYIHLDRDANVWFTHGVRNVGMIDVSVMSTSSWHLSTDGYTNLFTPLLIPDPGSLTNTRFDEELGGLAVDVLNRLWVIDSRNNLVIAVSATPVALPVLSATMQFKILPDSDISFAPDLITGETVTLSSSNYNSIQATSDWTGNRWLQKYSTGMHSISGISAPFTVHDYAKEFYFKKINEDYSAAEFYKSHSLGESQQSNTLLLNGFLGSVAGNAVPGKHEDVGEKIYEKIANFILQHSDIDTCSADQLLSHCVSTDVEAAKYAIKYPAELARIIDTLSISKDRLRGIQDISPVLSKSIGNILNTYTDIVTAGERIFLQDKFRALYTLVTVPVLSGVTVYPLSAFDDTGFIKPAAANYLFYKYVPSYPTNTDDEVTPMYIENVIDWNNQYTTLSYSLSSKKDWYAENGVLDKIYNYIITKNLFLNS